MNVGNPDFVADESGLHPTSSRGMSSTSEGSRPGTGNNNLTNDAAYRAGPSAENGAAPQQQLGGNYRVSGL